METLNRSIAGTANRYPEKVLQFGEGNFLRAFADWQIQELNEKAGFNGSVVVVQPRGSGKIERLNRQEGLFTLYLQGIKEGQEVNEHLVVDSISRGINLDQDYDHYLKLSESEDLRFVISNTTEAGIRFNENARLEDRPQEGFPAKLTAFLYHRFQTFSGDLSKGCVLIPCELIENNGLELKKVVLQYAEHWKLEPAFVEWLNEANTFCSSLVDRIVPGYPKDSGEEKEAALGYRDELMVVSEQYYLLVIEGPEGLKDELPFEKAGLNSFIVDDLTAYRERKVRILNGSHTAMLPVCYLYGLDTVSQSVNDEVTGAFIKELIAEEIIPGMKYSEEEMKAYAQDVLERFRNPYIHHFLSSLALNAISKFNARNVPSLVDYVTRKQQLPQRLTFALSALLYFYKGKRGEEDIPLDDSPEIIEEFKKLWQKVDSKEWQLTAFVQNILSKEQWWGRDLSSITGLTTTVAEHLKVIEDKGIKAALLEVNAAFTK
ncbi:tagaturonate reductase [Fictibacillus fluitans]|uniref:Tagaturonate reductase n=1 Tax=Fictibacillus fluitans TaxID=3058422 RepID=A0ABT8HTV2_9BACL|nr:tagaturonate reductase [Fictibacillus sp. NE201]MDN4524176.1 tagaturonate reductase [Fictibacillus sp. NE201]